MVLRDWNRSATLPRSFCESIGLLSLMLRYTSVSSAQLPEHTQSGTCGIHWNRRLSVSVFCFPGRMFLLLLQLWSLLLRSRFFALNFCIFHTVQFHAVDQLTGYSRTGGSNGCPSGVITGCARMAPSCSCFVSIFIIFYLSVCNVYTKV